MKRATTLPTPPRGDQPTYRLITKHCERPGCPATFQSYPKAFHPYCSLACWAIVAPAYFARKDRATA